MRILLAHNSTFYPALGGGDKSNRLLMEALAARGHAVRVVARMDEVSEAAHRRHLSDLACRGIAALGTEGGVVRFERNGVDVRTVTSNPHLRDYFRSQINDFDPDVIVCSTDDPAQILLEPALEAPRARVVFLARATIALPYGPDAAFRSATKTQALRTVDGTVGVSEYVADYIRKWSGIPAIHVPISLIDSGPVPDLGGFDNAFVTIVNPCAVKGIDVFLGLAQAMPDVRFAAVPSWGTNEEDFRRLRALPNVTLLEPSDNIDDILRRTRVMLVPSVWAEARSRMVVEAMSRGVPVLASNLGGLPEAKLGVPYLLPVNPIENYRPQYDDRMVPIAEVPPQDIEPWKEALQKVVTDRAHYEELSAASRAAALAYIANISAAPFEAFLQELCERPQNLRKQAQAAPALSPEKKRLLELRLRKRTAPSNTELWFPGIESASTPKLLCFPFAGGGSLAYRAWQPKLPNISVIGVRLPGRESRASEAPMRSMEELVKALLAALPDASASFLYGHSMGAVIAFELACGMRDRGMALPKALFVSGARAPRYRLDWTPPPDPTDAQFEQELRRLEGVPQELWSDPEAVKLVLPVLRADAALYRQYVYTPRAPLPIPIFVYGGKDDPNVHAEHLDAWASHTNAGVHVRHFEGGHFFIRTNQDFLNALGRDLASLS